MPITYQTSRLASQRTGATGTLKRMIAGSEAYFIAPQRNIFGAICGGKYIDASGKEVSAPKIMKRKEAESYKVEGFTSQEPTRYVTVTADATAAATNIIVSAADSALIPNNTMLKNTRTKDVMYLNASNPGNGTLTVARYSNSQALLAGDKLITLGVFSPEVSASLGAILVDESNHFNLTAFKELAFKQSIRDAAIDRYTGNSFANDKRESYRRIQYDEECMIIGSRRTESIGTNGITAPRGLEEYAEINGNLFDFGGTVEKSELRILGALIGQYNPDRLIMTTSIEGASNLISALDSSLRVSVSDLATKNGLPMAKSVQLGSTMVDIVPCGYYGLPGNEGEGLIFDPTKVSIYDLIPLQYFQTPANVGETMRSEKWGKWLVDGGCPFAEDGGVHIWKVAGMNNYAG